ncbi:hypothetical protein BV22DRAFT_1124340 [Leucogyrophana mollusca]|uniref:Uncharacterized protein n=1 Tax=Leucogyrophana mollusca TaxID=85980 RepID=A0ACB8C1G1_9AGAM|nr:hypothetical protein BV22DRAFT_1124340 [Leucogyrophana mollusca]
MTQEIKFNSFGVPYLVEFGNVSFGSDNNAKTSGNTGADVLGRPSLSPSPTTWSSSIPTLVYASSSASSCSSSTSSFCHISSSLSTPSLVSSTCPEKRAKSSPFASLSRSATMRSAGSFFKRKSTRRRADTYPPPSLKCTPSSPALTTWCAIPPYIPKPLPPIPFPQQACQVDGLYIQFSSGSSDPYVSSKNRLARLQKTIAAAVLEAGMDTPPAVEHEEPVCLLRQTSPTPGRECGLRESLFRGTYGQSGLKEATTRIGAIFVAHHQEEGGVQLKKLTLWS